MRRFWIAAAAVALGACAASPFEVVRPPLRDAALYPVADTRYAVTVAVDDIVDSERARRYFGADLPRAGIIPVNITVTNRSRESYRLAPADVLLRNGTEVIDPLRTETVAAAIERMADGLSSEARQRLGGYLAGIAFRSTVLAPDASYQGMLFFPVPESETDAGPFSVHTLFDARRLLLEMLVIERDGGNILRFGPLPIETPAPGDDAGWWW